MRESVCELPISTSRTRVPSSECRDGISLCPKPSWGREGSPEMPPAAGGRRAVLGTRRWGGTAGTWLMGAAGAAWLDKPPAPGLCPWDTLGTRSLQGCPAGAGKKRQFHWGSGKSNAVQRWWLSGCYKLRLVFVNAFFFFLLLFCVIWQSWSSFSFSDTWLN